MKAFSCFRPQQTPGRNGKGKLSSPFTEKQQSQLVQIRCNSVAESISSGVWDDKYIQQYGELKYATALLQGNRCEIGLRFRLTWEPGDFSLVLKLSGHALSYQLLSPLFKFREDMQDFLDVVPKARCGFLCAGITIQSCFTVKEKQSIQKKPAALSAVYISAILQ